MNKNIEKAINDYLIVNDLNDISKNPAIGSIFNLVAPIFGGALHDTIKTTFANTIYEKQKILINEIMKDNDIVIDDIPDKISFIHDCVRAHECVLKLKNNKKIIYFANILKSEYKKENITNRAEDFIELLNNISYETLTVLAKLYLYEIKHNIKSNSQLSEINVYWKDYISSCHTFGNCFSENFVNAHLSILQSKGICKEFTGSYSDYVGGVYKITEYGYLFIKSINNYQFEKEFIDPKEEIYEILKSGKQPDIDKYGVVKYYHYLQILEKEDKIKLSKPINTLNAPCSQYKVLEVY